MSQAHEIGSSEARPLEGIGGWLILLAVQQVLGPVQFAFGALQEYLSLPAELISRFALAFAGDFALRLAYLALLVYSAVLFFGKREAFPRVYMVTYAAGLAFPFVLATWVLLSTGVSIYANLSGATLGYYMLGVAIGAIWISYLLNSVRVRNTFVR